MTLERISIPHQILAGGVIAIGRGLDPLSIVRVGEGLAAGGIGAFEITLGRPGALDAIAALHGRFGGESDLLVGAGTILSQDDAEQAILAGAQFLVMPVTDPVLVSWAAARGIAAFPGAMTPTEALVGWRAGAAGIKLFPASVAGPTFVRELHGPFPDIPVIPTGGVTVETAPDFIVAGAVAVGIGSWLTGDGDPERIAERGQRIVAAIGTARAGGRR